MLEFEVKDEDGTPVDGFSASTENVCSEMESGGLAASTAKVSNVCGNVVATSVNPAVATQGVHTQGVHALGCSAILSAKTDKTGKATLTFCATSSTKFRIRGTGTLASRTICIVVAGKPCGTTSYTATSPGSSAPAVTAPSVIGVKKNTQYKLSKFLAPSKSAKCSYKTTGTCKISGALSLHRERFCHQHQEGRHMLGNSHRHPQGRQSKEVQRQSICDLIFTLPRRQG